MKKAVLIFTLIMLGATLLKAQINLPFKQGKLLTPQKLFGVVNGNKRLFRAQPRSADSVRLIGISYYGFGPTTYVISDSEQFNYHGTNGGTYSEFEGEDFETMKFDTENCYVYNSGNATFTNDTMTLQKYDANDNIDTTLSLIWDSLKLKWINAALSTYGYDANSNINFQTDYDWDTISKQWLPVDEARLVYSNNMVDTITGLVYNSGTSKYENYIKEYSAYNANNLIDTLAIQEWSGTAWVFIDREAVFYDSNNNDTAEVVKIYNAGNWTNDLKISSNFYPGTSLERTEYQLSWKSPSWDSAYKVQPYYDAASNDTANVETSFYQGEWLGLYKYTWQYNSFHQPVSYNMYNYIGNTYMPFTQELYYYQNYATGIKQLAVKSGQLSVYPNPTANQLTVESGQLIVKEITITNELGQMVYESLVTPKSPEGDFSVDVSTLPDGLYFVTVKADGGNMTQKVIVSR